MLRVCIVTVLYLFGVMVATPVVAERGPAQKQKHSPFMRIYGPSLPPHGYVAFCELNPSKCRADGGLLKRPELTTTKLLELDEVNRLVNEAIEPVTDQEVYGVSEFWTLPVDRGDCEDYALLKRQILIRRGWPKSALLLTVVRDENGAGHAVLTVRTAQGDFIADNKNSEIKGWQDTPYEYVMRQSYLNPRNWMRLGPARQQLPRSRYGSNR